MLALIQCEWNQKYNIPTLAISLLVIVVPSSSIIFDVVLDFDSRKFSTNLTLNLGTNKGDCGCCDGNMWGN